MMIEKRAMSLDFQIPKPWKSYAYHQGFSELQIEVLCSRFKEFYIRKAGDIQCSEFAWERRFREWVDSEKKIVAARPAEVPQTESVITPGVGTHYLALIKEFFKKPTRQI